MAAYMRVIFETEWLMDMVDILMFRGMLMKASGSTICLTVRALLNTSTAALTLDNF